MSTWRTIIISVMQGLQNTLQSQLARILTSNPSAQLSNQVKTFNTYERKIQEEIMAKSAQIMQLQNYLRSQIDNIQSIVEENNRLKKEVQVRDKELATKNLIEKDLLKDIQNIGEMNRTSNYIIKRLEERIQELEEEIAVFNQNNKKQLKQGFSQTQLIAPLVENKVKKNKEPSVNIVKNVVEITPFRPKELDKTSILQAKVAELQAAVRQLKFENSQLLLKIKCSHSPSNHSITQSQSQQLSPQRRKQTTQLLSMICEQLLPEIKFKGQLLNGSKQGKGVCEYEGNVYYQGYFKNNKRHGLGSLYAYEEVVYKGYWVEGLMEGKGVLRMLEGQIQSYEGQFREGKLEGYGYMKLKSGKRVLAFWKDGKIAGNCLQDNQKTKRLIKPELIECY